MHDSTEKGATIRILGPRDAKRYLEHRQRALREAPEAFVTSPHDDLATEVRVMRKYLDRAPHYAVFGAFAPGARGALVGSVGVHRDRLRKAALAHARGLDVERVQGSVGDASRAARGLLQRLGFRAWAEEPDALRCDGRSIAWVHVVRDLGAGESAR